MTTVDVVGGVYTEKCAFPYWDELLGSAGRAALGLVGHRDIVRLHTVLAPEQKELAEMLFPARGVTLSIGSRDRPITFDYLHSLAVPRISPRRAVGTFAKPVEGELVIKFGMLEADPTVHADYCVYDPQSAFSPKFFSASGSSAKHLAVVSNRFEVQQMTSEQDADAGVRKIFETDGAEIVIVKDGLNGATVYEGGRKSHIPAFKTDNVFTIGSGDIFVAAFAAGWAIYKLPPVDAAYYASMVTAQYVDTRLIEIPIPTVVQGQKRAEVKLAGGNIYLAGPFRETGQRMLINDAFHHLSALGMDVFSPIHHIGPGEADAVVQKDLAAIHNCSAVFAILNGSSPGTIFEVGYAKALNKPVYCVAQNLRHGDAKLPRGSGAFVYGDYVTALFQIAWRDT